MQQENERLKQKVLATNRENEELDGICNNLHSALGWYKDEIMMLRATIQSMELEAETAADSRRRGRGRGRGRG